MRPNIFQKILSLIYLLLISVCCIFYVPFRESNNSYNSDIKYDTIWSNNTNIDLFRIFIYLVVLSISFYLIYKYLNRMNEIEKDTYKKKARIELFILILFIVGSLTSLFYFKIHNEANQIREKSLLSKMNELETLISEKSDILKKKERRRKYFFAASEEIFNLNEFNDDNIKFWEQISKNKEESQWLNLFYKKFPKETLEDIRVKSPNELKKFIESNSIDNTDLKNINDLEKLYSKYGKITYKRLGIAYYDLEEAQHTSILYVSILFVLLYVFRPLLIFIKGMFVELK